MNSDLADELEDLRFAKDEAVQQAVADANNQIVQLKASVSALRDELEANMIGHEQTVQDLERAARDESNQLKGAIATLRDQLEATASVQAKASISRSRKPREKRHAE